MKNLLSFILLAIFSISALATPVGPMNYQGRLLDDNGIPVTGSYNFVVKIYDDPTAGVLQYQETHSGVSVDDGVYAFKVGTQTPQTGTWDLNLWQNNLNDLYLELVVNGETLTPRHELTSAPHAFTATLALGAESLGGKTAAEYDNILEGICVASKGKWLTKEEKCLGVQSVFTDPKTIADLMLDSGDLDFSGLDLTGADIRGIDFSGADLSGTVFDHAKVDLSKFAGANLSNTHWDSAQNVGGNLSGAVNLSNAWIKHFTGLTGSSLASATVTGLSAAYLDACPGTVGISGSNLPVNWICLEQDPLPSGQYFLVGPGANLSATSALAVDNFGTITLPIPQGALDGTEGSLTNLTGIDFRGVTFYNETLEFINFSNAKFDYGSLNFVSLAGSSLSGSTLIQTGTTGSVLPDNISYDNLNIDGVNITVDTNATKVFNGTVLSNSTITLNRGATLILNDGQMNNVAINSLWGTPSTANNTLTLNNSIIQNSTIGLRYVELQNSSAHGVTIDYPDPGASNFSVTELTLDNSSIHNSGADIKNIDATNAGFYNANIKREGSSADAAFSGKTTIRGGSDLYLLNVPDNVAGIDCKDSTIYMLDFNADNSTFNNCTLEYGGTLVITNSTLIDMGESFAKCFPCGGGRYFLEQYSPDVGFTTAGVVNMSFDYVTFVGNTHFGYNYQASFGQVHISNSLFAPGSESEMSSMHPAATGPISFLIENTNFLDESTIYGENQSYIGQAQSGYAPVNGQLVFVNSYFENANFKTHIDSQTSSVGAKHVFDGNSFFSPNHPVFWGAVDISWFNGNGFEGATLVDPSYTYLDNPTNQYCAAYLDAAVNWGQYPAVGTNIATQNSIPVVGYNSGSCDGYCGGSNACGISVGSPPGGRGNPN